MSTQRKPLRQVTFQVLGSIASLALLAAAASCTSTAEPPSPEFFGPQEKQVRSDPRQINFHNRSVEVAELEILIPAKPVEDCNAEAPHRLLCPTEYQQLVATRVHPRKVFEASYPEKLPLDCAHVWLRVHSKAMDPNEFQEAIFLLAKREDSKGLVLELQDGPTAQLKLEEEEELRRFPAPLRYCDKEGADQPALKATVRPPDQAAEFAAAAAERVGACCKDRKCGRIERAELLLRRDGAVLSTKLAPMRGRIEEQQRELETCIHQAVQELRFPGFTQHQTTAQVVLKPARVR